MRKVLLFVLTIIFCFFTTSCDPARYYFPEENTPGILSIQLGIYNNNNCKNVEVEKDTILKFDRTKLEIIEELEHEKKEAFLKDFGEISFMVVDESANEPMGYCLLLNLENNNSIVVSCTKVKGVFYGMFAEFDKDGQFQRHIAAFDGPAHFENVLADYFETYIKIVE